MLLYNGTIARYQSMNVLNPIVILIAKYYQKETKMPAKSKAQQRFMGLCAHNPEKARGKCPPKDVAEEFAKTKTKNLPEKKSSKKKS